MSVICPHCKNVFEADAKYLKSQGTNFDYYTCPACGKPVRWPAPVRATAAAAAEPAAKSGPTATSPVPGWLVVGDARTPPQRLPLRVGDNLVGRRSTQYEVQVAIDTTDTAMSRRHCLITVAPDAVRGRYTFQVQDNNAANHLFIGDRTLQNQLSDQDIVFVKDGEKLLLGETLVTLEVNKLAFFEPRAKPGDTVVQH